MGKSINWLEFEKPVMARFLAGDVVRAKATARRVWAWASDGVAVSSVVVNHLYNQGLLEITFDAQQGNLYSLKRKKG